MSTQSVATPSTNERLGKIFNTRAKRVGLMFIRIGALTVGTVALGAGIWTGNPFIAAPAAAFVVYALNLENSLNPERDLYSRPEPFKVSNIGAATLAVFAAIGSTGALQVSENRKNFEAEQTRIGLLPTYTEPTVTIPATTVNAQDYFCRNLPSGIRTRTLPDGKEYKFNCPANGPK